MVAGTRAITLRSEVYEFEAALQLEAYGLVVLTRLPVGQHDVRDEIRI